MSELPEYAIRRILVALDASQQSFAALHQAAEMAAALQAELIGMFVEDINLLRSALFPFARFVSYPSGRAEPAETARLEREMQAQAEKARRALAQAAELHHRPWSFRCVRGSVPARLLEAAAQVDVVIMGRSGLAPRPADALGSTAAIMLRHAPGALLIARGRQDPHAPVQAVYDGTRQAGEVLRTAASYALARGVGLVILAPAADEQAFLRLAAQARSIADHRFGRIEVARLAAASPELLARAAAAHGRGMILIPGNSELLSGQAVASLLAQVPNPILLIRAEQAESAAGK